MAADDDYLDFLNRIQRTQPGRTVSPTSGTVTRPSSGAPSTIPGTNIPVPTTRPSRPASVRRPGTIGREISELEDLLIAAKNQGIEVPSDVIPQSMKEDQPWYKDVLGAAGTAGNWLLYGITAPGRVIASTGRELGETAFAALPQGAQEFLGLPKGAEYRGKGSLSEWYTQLGDPDFYGTKALGAPEPSAVRLGPSVPEEDVKELLSQLPEGKYPDATLTGNIWTDRVVGLAFDIATDPLNYLSPGGGALSKTTAKAGEELAARSVQKALTGKGRDWLIRQGANATDVIALERSDDIYRTLGEELNNAIKINDAASIDRIKNEIDIIDGVVREATKSIAIKTGLRGSKILKAEELRVAAYKNYTNTVYREGQATAEAVRAQDAFNLAESVYGRESDEAVAALQNWQDTVWRSGRSTPAAKAAAKELDTASEKLVIAAGKKAGRRTYRMSAREQLAENARQVRQYSQRMAADLTISAEQRLMHQNTVNVLTDEVIKDLATRGWNAVRGDVGRALGSPSGARLSIGIPRTTLRVGGFVPSVTGGKFGNALGSAAIAARLKLLEGDRGEFIIRYMTPLGRKGIFTEDEIRTWRGALQSGKATPKEAAQFVALIEANKRYALNLKRNVRNIGVMLRDSLEGITEEEGKLIRQALESGDEIITPGPNWASSFASQASTGPFYGPELADKYRQVKDFMDFMQNEVDSLIKLEGGAGVGYLANYFPHAQTEDALRWIANNPKAGEQVGALLGMNRQFLADNFIQRTLVEGSNWFGHTLTRDDILRGVDRLNELARENRLGIKIDFDFFETDLRKALAGYAYTHARQMSTLQAAVELAPRSLVSDPLLGRGITEAIGLRGETGAQEVAQRIGARSVATGRSNVDFAVMEMESLIRQLDSVGGLAIIPDSIVNSIQDDIARLLTDLADPRKVGYIDVGGVLIPKAYFESERVLEQIIDMQRILQEYIDEARGLTSGNVPIQFRDAMSANFAQEMDDLRTLLLGSQRQLDDAIQQIEPAQWIQIFKQFEDGWEALKVGNITLPEIGVTQELNEIFSNVKRIEDPVVARKFEQVFNDINAFFKTYATATPGFVSRNTLGNLWSVFAAGVNLDEYARGIKYYTQYFGKNRARYAAGRPLLTPVEYVSGLKGLSMAQKRLIEQAINATDTSSNFFLEAFGRQVPSGIDVSKGTVSERIFGQNAVGVLGQPVRRGPLKGARRAAAAIPTAIRGVGAVSENMNRFALTYDGLMKGLSETEALARTNKYLFDYADLSRTDRVLRQIIPFWYWASRNFPLQIEMMLTDPKVFARYGQIRNALRAEEQPDYIPQYLTEAGAFQVEQGIPVIGGTLAAPDLGFPGAGIPSIGFSMARGVAGLATGRPSKFTEGLLDVLSGLNPPARALLEKATGIDLLTRKPIAKGYRDVPTEAQEWLVVLSRALPAAPWSVRLYNQIGNLGKELGIIDEFNEFVPDSERWQIFLNSFPAYTEGMSIEEADAIARAEDQRKIQQYFGLPFRKFTEQQELSEIARRQKVLRDLLEQARR